ncbi:RagB/SusD family nutrient uptake outer membrane protein [Siphonobacter aquaeclarae]|uniref:Starch-binding associating with outer membrane n=1 Tax=Siphonobacter aquaeclarae TaxID=563176 RepID=A0A1G9IIX0_9BACT|nr:RagB/SusD family nutrient uptake outer membrane protein [Siphonobacter aquaeclarae]SDL24955.1 Starch-binding associating with outer membrane [Siphonobacter aquaeclarae]
MKRNKLILALSALMLGTQACTDLTEKTYDVIPTNQFGGTADQQAALIGPLYNALGGYWENHFWLNTSTDEQMIPTRGGDWGDGNQWVRLYTHTWDPALDNGRFNGPWTWCYNPISKINIHLATVTDAKTKAELRALRAMFHYQMLDYFGNVIISDNKDDLAPKQSTRKEVFNWIEKELLEAYPDLVETVGGAYYTRFNKYVVDMILAKLYLNAEVYTGTPRWQDAITRCDNIIKSNKFSLAPDFFSTFSVNNQNAPESILSTAFDKTKRTGFFIQMATLHYKQQLEFNIGNSPWNGPCAVTEFFNSFTKDDLRYKMWMVGQRFAADGTKLMDDNIPLVLNPEVPALVLPAGADSRVRGARCAKYEIQKNNPYGDQDNDFVIFRLGDVYLMRGEAYLRLGKTAEALADVNVIRARAGVPTYTAATLTLDELLAERGRELAWEGHRRQDLIRFGQYNKAWRFKPASQAFRNLFPIPNDQLALNKNLKQNPGY